MNHGRRTIFALAAALAICVTPGPLRAASLLTLHDFAPGISGYNPTMNLVKGTDGNLWGTTLYGGAVANGTDGGGTVYKMTTAGVVTIVHNFSPSDSKGCQPLGVIQATDGNFYGICRAGGSQGHGAVFKLTPSGTYSILHSFTGGSTDGANPYSGIMQASDGFLYGCASNGGTSSRGVVYKIATDGGSYSILHSFTGADGGGPKSVLLQGADSFLYGTTLQGTGDAGAGTIFKISTTGDFTDLHHMVSGTEGGIFVAGLVQGADGTLYGTTTSYGPGGNGTVFKCTTTGTVTVLHSFSGTDGNEPFAPVTIATDGNLYGTTMFGGTHGDGTVFKVTTTGTFTKLHDLGDADGWQPQAGLVQAASGYLYGTTTCGKSNAGIAFKTSTSGTFSIAHNFTYADGSGGISDLVQDPLDGSFYGTTKFGGSGGNGSVFRTTLDGTTTTLHSFNLQEGTQPLAGLVFGADGNLYGSTSRDGVNDGGSLFKISTAGLFTLLDSLPYNSATSPGQVKAPLIQATDGNLYGVSVYGGAHQLGTIFKMTPAGVITIVHSGNNTMTDISYPYSPLIQAPDGTFFGVSGNGGSGGYGALYHVTTSGGFSIGHSFSSTDGAYPIGSLAFGTDGKLYGTTETGGTNDWGTVYSVGSGAFSTVYNFTGGTDGGRVSSGLIKGKDGLLYGRTSVGGHAAAGTLFTIGPTSPFAILASLPAPADYTTYADVVQAADGSFYGTSFVSGLSGAGSVFRMVLDTNAHNVVMLQSTTSNAITLWNTWNDTVFSAPVVTTTPGSGWKAVGFADFNGDGHPDLLLQNASTGALYIYHLNGAKFLTATPADTVPPVGTVVVGVGTFGSTDGKPDVLLQNTSTRAFTVWHMNDNVVGTKTNVAQVPTAGWKVIGVGDFNSDHKSDIVFQNLSTSQLLVWYMNGTVYSTNAVCTPPAGVMNFSAVVNLSGKGYPDIVYQHTGGTAPGVLHMGANFKITSQSTLPAPAADQNVAGPK